MTPDIEKNLKELGQALGSDDSIVKNVMSRIEGDKIELPQPTYNVWRIIMKSKMIKFAAAAVVILAVFLTVTFFDKSIPTAYAIEQTLEAMQNLRTVHMQYKDWNNNEHEMWIQLDSKTGVPEYCRSYCPKLKSLDISTPQTSYQYSERANLVQVNSGKLYNIGVAPAKIFEQLLQCSKMNDPNFKVQILNEYSSEIGKNLIVAISETPYDSWKIFIDPETKLPVRMYCLKRVNKMGALFKDIDKIEFNVDLPEDIFKFDIPKGARIIDHDYNNKILSDPKYGISADGMTEQQAAEQIATTYWNALIAMDKITAQKMAPVSAQMVDGSLLAELVEVGKLYVEPGCGIGKLIPCKIRYKDNSMKMWKLVIKSRNIDGKPSCVIDGYFDSPREIK
jgi:outer membrane lipoprotein-sorting protein